MLFNKMNNLKHCNLWNLVIVATRLYSTIYVVVFLWSDRTVEKKIRNLVYEKMRIKPSIHISENEKQ